MFALVFPGQGSQYVGMGRDLYEKNEEVKALFAKAEEITAIPVKKLIFEGPMEELTLTENLQVCITLINISCFEVLKKHLKEKIFEKVFFVAGHSLGEFSALYAGEVLSLEDTFRVVKKRAEVMGKAGGNGRSGMYALLNISQDKLEAILSDSQGRVVISNYNSPKQLVISGEEPALSEVAERAKACGAKVIKLKVSAGFHSPLMREAEEEFVSFLSGVEFKDARIPFVSNVSARAERSGEKIKDLMQRQITSPVRWIDVIEYIYAQGVANFIELGPKQVLKGLISQILEGRPFQCYNVENLETLFETLKAFA